MFPPICLDIGNGGFAESSHCCFAVHIRTPLMDPLTALGLSANIAQFVSFEFCVRACFKINRDIWFSKRMHW